ncbi:MAG: LamG-like jellyroll fold domain-containing protein, partial [Phycisphaerae bacterium]
HPGRPRSIVIQGRDSVAFKPAPLGQVIRYTLDGAQPTTESRLYTGPIEAAKSCTLRARAFARYWPFDRDNASKTLEVRLERRSLAQPVRPSKQMAPGLACEVFERHHTIFDTRTGIFTGRRNMLPSLEDPLLACRVPSFDVPAVKPPLPAREMAKGYYRYRGFLKLDRSGVHAFRVDSCGPVVLTVGGQVALSVTGPYGLSLKPRFGQAALRAGLHGFELIVCDPVFWKAGQDGPYPLTVSRLAPGETRYRPIPSNVLFTDQPHLKPAPEPKVLVGKAVKPGKSVPGLVMNRYDRVGSHDSIPGDGLPPAHFKIRPNEKPYLSRPVLALEGSDSTGLLIEYAGYLIADAPGVYQFELDRKGASQLWIDGQLVQHSRVAAAAPAGAIRLDAGHHAFSLRLTHSAPTLRIKAPGREAFESPDIGLFARPADAVARHDGRLLLHLDGEGLAADGALKNLAGPATALRKGKLAPGKKGRGIKVTGADSRLEVRGLRTPDNAFSMSFWNRIDQRVDRGLLDNSWTSHPGGRLRGYTIWAFYFRGGPNAAFDLRKVGADEGAWCHVAITYGQAVRLYVNGELRDWSVKEVAARHARVTDLVLFRDLDATVDDVRLYNRVLSEADIRSLAK